MSQLPNVLTVFRLILVAPIVYCVITERWVEVLVLLVIAALSDAIDGALARRFNWISKFGQMADPIADKMIFGMVLVFMTFKGLIPLWLMLVVIGRDLIVFLGAGAYRLVLRHWEVEPTLVSKVSTVVQVVVLLFVILGTQDWLVSEWALLLVDPIGYYVAAGIAAISGITYVYLWGMRARDEWHLRFPKKVEIREKL